MTPHAADGSHSKSLTCLDPDPFSRIKVANHQVSGIQMIVIA